MADESFLAVGRLSRDLLGVVGDRGTFLVGREGSRAVQRRVGMWLLGAGGELGGIRMGCICDRKGDWVDIHNYMYMFSTFYGSTALGNS